MLNEKLKKSFIEAIRNNISLRFLREFEYNYKNLLIDDEIFYENKFVHSFNQKKLSIADGEFNNCVEAMVKSADNNSILVYPLGSGKNIVEIISVKRFNIAPYRKGCGTLLNSKYKKALAESNILVDLYEIDDLFKKELIEESKIDAHEKLFLLLGVFVRRENGTINVECSFDIPSSNGKNIIESIPFREIFEFNDSESVVSDNDNRETDLVVKLKKMLDVADTEKQAFAS